MFDALLAIDSLNPLGRLTVTWESEDWGTAVNIEEAGGPIVFWEKEEAEAEAEEGIFLAEGAFWEDRPPLRTGTEIEAGEKNADESALTVVGCRENISSAAKAVSIALFWNLKASCIALSGVPCEKIAVWCLGRDTSLSVENWSECFSVFCVLNFNSAASNCFRLKAELNDSRVAKNTNMNIRTILRGFH